MNYNATITIPKDELARYESMFGFTVDDFEKNGITPLEAIEIFTAEFADGCEADIKLNASEDDIWSEGVLFSENGCEITHTDVSFGLSGLWSFDVGNDTYEVEVIGI